MTGMNSQGISIPKKILPYIIKYFDIAPNKIGESLLPVSTSTIENGKDAEAWIGKLPSETRTWVKKLLNGVADAGSVTEIVLGIDDQNVLVINCAFFTTDGESSSILVKENDEGRNLEFRWLHDRSELTDFCNDVLLRGGSVMPGDIAFVFDKVEAGLFLAYCDLYRDKWMKALLNHQKKIGAFTPNELIEQCNNPPDDLRRLYPFCRSFLPDFEKISIGSEEIYFKKLAEHNILTFDGSQVYLTDTGKMLLRDISKMVGKIGITSLYLNNEMEMVMNRLLLLRSPAQMWLLAPVEVSEKEIIFTTISSDSVNWLISEFFKFLSEKKVPYGAGKEQARPESKKIFCPSCGASLPSTAKFCRKCGKPVQPDEGGE